jgi:uncharacterized protein
VSGFQWTISLDEIPEQGLQIRITESPAFFHFEVEDVSWQGLVEWTGDLQRFGRDVICRGRARAGVVQPCSRCLREVDIDLETETTFTFVPEPPQDVEGEEVEVESQDPDIYVYQEGRLSLRNPVRDSLIMTLPLQPVCREGCKGLCSTCGADLNEGACDCAQEANDPRWEALTRLRGTTTSEKT